MKGRISICGSADLPAVMSLVRTYPFLFDGQFRGDVAQELLANAYLSQLRLRLTAPDPLAYASWSGQGIVGLGILDRLDWDTNHFGASMARLTVLANEFAGVPGLGRLVQRSLRVAKASGIEHVAVRLPLALHEGLAAMCSNAFRPVGVKLMLRHRDEGSGVGTSRLLDYQLDALREADVDQIVTLAGSALSESRFFQDGRFPEERVRAMYGAWVERIWRASPEHVVVVKKQGKVLGFLAYEIGIGYYGLSRAELGGLNAGFVGLVAVADDARGQGLGKELIREGLRRMSAQGCERIYANVMATNEGSVNAFLRAGFTLMGTLQELHRWI